MTGGLSTVNAIRPGRTLLSRFKSASNKFKAPSYTSNLTEQAKQNFHSLHPSIPKEAEKRIERQGGLGVGCLKVILD